MILYKNSIAFLKQGWPDFFLWSDLPTILVAQVVQVDVFYVREVVRIFAVERTATTYPIAISCNNMRPHFPPFGNRQPFCTIQAA